MILSRAKEWNAASLAELIDYIVEVHHSYVRSELPGLVQLLARIINKWGDQDGSLGRTLQNLHQLQKDLDCHMSKEEVILFPAVKRLENRQQAALGSLSAPIRMMLREHEAATHELAAIRAIAVDLDEGACEMYRVLLRGLEALEVDLCTHVRLENDILFPRALRLELQDCPAA